MTSRYNLPDEGSQQWYADPLNPAVADLDRRVGLNESDVAAALAAADAAAITHRQPTAPWPDHDPAHAGADVGDLWFDTSGNPVRLSVPNPGFETDTSGWETIHGNDDPSQQGYEQLTRVTTQAHSGTASGQVYVYYDIGCGVRTALIDVASSTTYTASAWLKGYQGGEALTLRLEDQNGSVIAQQNVTLTEKWQQFVLTGRSRSVYDPAGPSTGIRFSMSTTYISQPFWFVDDLVIEGPSAGEQTDGLITPYFWSGSAWELIRDVAIGNALAAAHNAQETADLAAVVYRQPTKPWPDGDPAHADQVGDLWLDTHGDPVKLTVPNPGFETDTSGWSVFGSVFAGGGPHDAVLTRDTTQAQSGVASGKVFSDGLTNNPQGVYSPPASALPSTTYTASVWLKGNTGGEALTLNLYASDAVYVSGLWIASRSVTLTTAWQQLSITGITLSNSTGVFVQIGTRGGSHPEATWFIDDLVIQGPAGVLTDQAKPYYWTGTEWVATSDSAIADAQAAADAAQTAANAAQATATTALEAVSYHHVQGVVSDTWSIQHNLGYHPNVTVQDSAGDTWEGAVTYDDNNHLTIRFMAPFSGVADLS
jgi:hypothetical protein